MIGLKLIAYGLFNAMCLEVSVIGRMVRYHKRSRIELNSFVIYEHRINDVYIRPDMTYDEFNLLLLGDNYD